MTHYRLTIANDRGATTFCISAATDVDAGRKAAEIARQLNVPKARIQLAAREHGAASPSIFEPRGGSYWGA